MKIHPLYAFLTLTAFFLLFSSLNATENANESALPEEMQKILLQKKYAHSIWGVYVKDLQTGNVLYDLNSEKLFSPASTTKLVSTAALLHAFGDDYRFKTPVYAQGNIEAGQLQGNLILVAQGDLTMGGRQSNAEQLSFTKMDHITANAIPAFLTKEDPLNGINDLARQVYQYGIKEITGDVLIDDTLFETILKRDLILTPIMINENLIDLVINPTAIDQKASLTYRPEVSGYTVDNQVKTAAKGTPLEIEISSDMEGHHVVVTGRVPLGHEEIVRTFSIKDPKSFARDAFIQALKKQGVKINLVEGKTAVKIPSDYKDLQQVALWTSPPLSEYVKLILKVSHNLGADLVPLLLASQDGKKTFNEGMLMLGDFAVNEVKLSPDSFVLIDAAGENENRLSLQAEVQLLEYMHKQKPEQFKRYFDALPVLGVNGSLEDFAKNSPGAGKVHAKPGTGIAFNLATGKFFLITQALAGYIEGKNGHLYAYEVVVNNASLPAIDDIYAIFEDEGQLSSMIYNHSDTKE